MNCNQDRLPILFLQDVNGFMVGRDSERAGIIKAAQAVNAITNSRCRSDGDPGRIFGAGNYALCGKAFDPRLIFAWPTARCAVMGGEQATARCWRSPSPPCARGGHDPDEAELEQLRHQVETSYQQQTNVRFGAARLWVDRILDPSETRAALLLALEVATRFDEGEPFKTGVLQV